MKEYCSKNISLPFQVSNYLTKLSEIKRTEFYLLSSKNDVILVDLLSKAVSKMRRLLTLKFQTLL